MSEALHPKTPHHLPGFITAPGDTDTLMVAVGIFLIGAVLMVGIFYLHLHTMPERMAHKSQKLQFEIVAVLGLLALFTHVHHLLDRGPVACDDRPAGLQHAAAEDRWVSRKNGRRSTGAGSCRSAGPCRPSRGKNLRRGEDQRYGQRHQEQDKARSQAGGAGQCLNFSSAPPSRSFRTISIAAIGRESASATNHALFGLVRAAIWLIMGCLMLTVSLITMIFYFHPSTNTATLYYRTVPIMAERIGRVAEVNVDVSASVKQGDVIFELDSAKQEAALLTAKRKIAEVDAAMVSAESDVAKAEGQLREQKFAAAGAGRTRHQKRTAAA